MATYGELTGAGIGTRAAADLTGVPRSSATRAATVPLAPPARTAPANALSVAERAHLLGVLDGADFVDASPAQVHAVLLDQGTYLASLSTMYRVLAANKQVKERRRQASHPSRAIPELVAASLAHARVFIEDFVAWHNHAYRHSGIGMHTPAQVHHGGVEQVRDRRSAAMATARAAHPERFATGSALLPAALDLPTHAWINKPDDPQLAVA